jgi:chromosome segregation ATPase
MSEDINEAGRLKAALGEEGTEVEGQIRRVQEKLQQLLRQRDVLLKENGKLKEEVRQLQQDQTGNTKRLEQLQQQVEILRVTKAAMSEGEKKELEKRLGQYIREIDRCITLLGEG